MRRVIAGIAAVLAVGGGIVAPVRADEDADRYITLGQYLLFAGDIPKAFENFNDAIDEDPEYAPAYLARGRAWEVTGEFRKAVADFSQAITLGLDRSPYAYTVRAGAWAAAGDRAQAIADYDRALALNAGCWPAIAGRGAALAENGEHARALADLDRAIAHVPGTIKETLAIERFQVLARKGPGGQGTRTLSVTIQTAPLLTLTYLARGKLRFAMGAYKPALADLDSALGRVPAFPAARLYRGLTLLALGRCAEGQDDLRRLGTDDKAEAAMAAALAQHRAAVEKAGCKSVAP